MKCAFVTLLAMALPSLVYASPDFVVVQQKINPVTPPQTAGEVIVECTKNVACLGVADRVVQLLGVPKGMIGVVGGLFTVSRQGENGKYFIGLPSGYQYCRTSIHMISIAPRGGERASAFGVSNRKDGVGISTWVPKGKVGEGRNWIEADFTVVGVQDGLAEKARQSGQCKSYGKILMDCRGDKGGKGKPGCGSTSD